MDIVPRKIQDLPDEVIGLILKYLNRSDIASCSATCQRWNQIIPQLIYGPYLRKKAKNNEDLNKILKEQGWTKDCSDHDLIVKLYKKHKLYSKRIFITSHVVPTEIMDLFDPKFKWISPADPKFKWLYTNFPKCNGIFGGLLSEKIIIIGGYTYYILGHNNPKRILLEPRYFGGCVPLNNDILWVVGGRNDTSTEFIKLNQDNPTQGPEFPVSISHHGMIKYDEKYIFVIGGIQNKETSHKTWIVDMTKPNHFVIKEGPCLKEGRSDFAFGKMVINDKTILIVAGGRFWRSLGTFSNLDSVEMLDPTSHQGWTSGPKLPYTLRQSAMVTSPAGNGVIIIGGNGENNGESYHPKIMLELKTKTTDSRRTMEWVELSQKLISTRESPIAIAIPDDLSP